MDYELKKAKAIEQFNLIKGKGHITLKPKFTSHTFRERKKKNKLDLRMFDQVINVDIVNQTVEVEGLTTFYNLTKKVLSYGYLPVIVPELRNLTIGGTIAGLGLESSSFKYGMVHNAVIDCEVLTPSGKVIKCSREENSDLFYGLPNSLGTLGYILKCTYKIIPTKKFIKVVILRYKTSEEYFKTLEEKCNLGESDFIDGVIFSSEDFIIIEGYMTDEIPEGFKTMNFKQYIYWKYLQDKNNTLIYFNTWDYLWRWDADAFWALNVGLYGKIIENKLFRKTLGRIILKSSILSKLNHIYTKLKSSKITGPFLRSLDDNQYESIIQDPCIDISKCSSFVNWLNKNIEIYPLWVCPSSNKIDKGKYPLHNFLSDYLVDIGIYTGKKRPNNTSLNYYNRMIEKKVLELKCMKGLYSTSFFTKDEFWSMYEKDRYDELKLKYDPNNFLPDIYSKTIGKITL